MSLNEQEAYFDGLVGEMRHIMLKKGNDYAGVGAMDRLSNFKNAGQITGITPQQQCLSLIATKVARLGTLLAPGAAPNNESVADSIIDLSCYSVLLGMLNYELMIQPSLIPAQVCEVAVG